MRFKPRTDANQKAVVAELRQRGYSVMLTQQLGKGRSDFVVGAPGVNLLVELKTDEKQVLTPDELDFHREWKGPLLRAETADQIADYMKLLGGIFS